MEPEKKTINFAVLTDAGIDMEFSDSSVFDTLSLSFAEINTFNRTHNMKRYHSI